MAQACPRVASRCRTQSGAPVSFGITGDGMRAPREGTLYGAAHFDSQQPVAHLDDPASGHGAYATQSAGGGHVEVIDHGDGTFSTVPTYGAGHEEEPLPDWMKDDNGPPDKHYEPLGYGDA